MGVRERGRPGSRCSRDSYLKRYINCRIFSEEFGQSGRLYFEVQRMVSPGLPWPPCPAALGPQQPISHIIRKIVSVPIPTPMRSSEHVSGPTEWLSGLSVDCME